MHHLLSAGRLVAAGTLTLVLATAAAAELTKAQCHDARVALGGFMYQRTAACPATLDLRECLLWANAPLETWSNALTAQGCPPWPSESDLVVRAYFARLEPPAGFWDDCGVEAGVCGGTCAEPFHACQDVAGECACASTLPD